MDRTPALARRLFDRLEPVHACTYFAPEAAAAMTDLGLKGFWMGYFAARSAPLGVVTPDVVTALFYNFAPSHVARALPAAWQITTPAAALQAREQAAVTALSRYGLTDDDTLRTAAELLAKAATSAPVDGRALYAANRSLPWPDAPVARLWHATTLLREHRGDGHVATLVSLGITGREANLLHCASGAVSEAFIKRSRKYDEDEWNSLRQNLFGRGLLAGDGTLSSAGAALKKRVEAGTDALALSGFEALSDSEVQTLFATLTPLTRIVVAAGDIPAVTPMGLRRDELDDDSAELLAHRQ